MRKSVLFIINGFGMGNATRCDALMDFLSPGYHIDVITSDKAALYFENSPKVRNLYRQTDLNLSRSVSYGTINYYVSYIPHFLKRIFLNYGTQKKIIQSETYTAVYFDSDYSFVLHSLFSKNRKIIGINNSYEVLAYMLRHPLKLKRTLLGSFLIEVLDFFVYWLFCRYVISPSLDFDFGKPHRLRFRKILLSPSLVRKSVVSMTAQESPHALIMATSSNVATPLKKLEHTFIAANQRELRSAKVIVCNSGQSSLSECLYLNKKALIMEIPNHVEQYVNSMIAAGKGLTRLSPNAGTYGLENKINSLLSEDATHDYGYNYSRSSRIIEDNFSLIESELP